MAPINPSGYYYPNVIARTYLLSMQELLGSGEMLKVLRESGLERFADNFPPGTYERKFDFADFAALNASLERLHSADEGPLLAYQVGYATFQGGMKNFGGLIFGSFSLSFRALPLPVKVKLGLLGMASVFSAFTDQLSELEETPDYLNYKIKNCPICWGRQSAGPICHGASGLLEAGLQWVADGKVIRAPETQCRAMGHDACVFAIDKHSLG